MAASVALGFLAPAPRTAQRVEATGGSTQTDQGQVLGPPSSTADRPQSPGIKARNTLLLEYLAAVLAACVWEQKK